MKDKDKQLMWEEFSQDFIHVEQLPTNSSDALPELKDYRQALKAAYLSTLEKSERTPH